MTRRTKIIPKKEGVIGASLKLRGALTTPEIFQRYQRTFLLNLYVNTL